jgi:5-methyltetrahydrofolate--homocysteine methyltransferase
MPIHFEPSRWNTIRKTYALWWKRELDRPLMNVWLTGAHEREAPNAPLLSQANCHDLSVSPEEIIEGIDYYLQGVEFLGDSFPFFNFDVFGPGVLSALCGARLDNSSGRVWFFPERDLGIEEIHVKYNPDNVWAKRIKDIYRAGMNKWQGQVLLGLPDIGGPHDVAAVFRGSENLLMDLYDDPEEVKRLCNEVWTAWHEAYADFESVLNPVNPGYSHWCGLYSEKSSYVLQSDFSYMIGPDMFAEHVLPLIKKDCACLNNAIYHLDGVGQLAHLDDLLALEDLDAVQWVYGDGKPSAPHWIDVYKRIEAAGKGIQIVGGPDDIRGVYTQVKNNLYYTAAMPAKDRRIAEELVSLGK